MIDCLTVPKTKNITIKKMIQFNSIQFKIKKVQRIQTPPPTTPDQAWCPALVTDLTFAPDAAANPCSNVQNPKHPPQKCRGCCSHRLIPILQSYATYFYPCSDSKTTQLPTNCCLSQTWLSATHSHTLIPRKCMQRDRQQFRWQLRAVGWHWSGSQRALILILSSSFSVGIWLDRLGCYYVALLNIF